MSAKYGLEALKGFIIFIVIFIRPTQQIQSADFFYDHP